MIDREPAFPRSTITGSDGMSLRDWFAATIPLNDWEIEQVRLRYGDSAKTSREFEAALRYAKADAMLKERENERSNQ